MCPSVGRWSNGEVNNIEGDHVTGQGGNIKCSKSNGSPVGAGTSTIVTGYIFHNIFRIFRTFSTLVISTFHAFSATFSTSFIMFISTYMANFFI